MIYNNFLKLEIVESLHYLIINWTESNTKYSTSTNTQYTEYTLWQDSEYWKVFYKAYETNYVLLLSNYFSLMFIIHLLLVQKLWSLVVIIFRFLKILMKAWTSVEQSCIKNFVFLRNNRERFLQFYWLNLTFQYGCIYSIFDLLSVSVRIVLT